MMCWVQRCIANQEKKKERKKNHIFTHVTNLTFFFFFFFLRPSIRAIEEYDLLLQNYDVFALYSARNYDINDSLNILKLNKLKRDFFCTITLREIIT